jgi:hypothetical protein
MNCTTIHCYITSIFAQVRNGSCKMEASCIAVEDCMGIEL